MQALNLEITPNRDSLAMRGDERSPPLEGYFWHTQEEPCPACGSQLLHERLTGFWLKCPCCGWKGW
jgi:hypothetical protein